jgi:hypothetical protein
MSVSKTGQEQLGRKRSTGYNFVLLPAGGKCKIESEEQLIKLVTGETDVPIKTPPSAAPVRQTV